MARFGKTRHVVDDSCWFALSISAIGFDITPIMGNRMPIIGCCCARISMLYPHLRSYYTLAVLHMMYVFPPGLIPNSTKTTAECKISILSDWPVKGPTYPKPNPVGMRPHQPNMYYTGLQYVLTSHVELKTWYRQHGDKPNYKGWK